MRLHSSAKLDNPQRWCPFLCYPEPDPLDHISGITLGPHDGIKSSLATVQVSLRRVPPLRPLEDLPEEEQPEVDGNADIVGDEGIDVKAASNGVEAIEEDNETEEGKADPREVGLEWGLEDQGVAVNALGSKGLVELDVGNANRHPGEHRTDSSQVLEPGECFAGTSRSS